MRAPEGPHVDPLPHARQEKTSDNLKILQALINSSGIRDLQRMLGCGIALIYDRIFWLEQTLLAFEQEMLRRHRDEIERKRIPVERRLCHDDIVLTVNWETNTDRKTTPLTCSVTADADSGYVHRIDVDLDPRIEPVSLFNKSYVDEQGLVKNLETAHVGANGAPIFHPKFHWERPTGRLHERYFFASCLNQLGVFREQKVARMPASTPEERAERDALDAELAAQMDRISVIYYDWFNLKKTDRDHRASFRGSTTSDIYTKIAHFIALKEMLPAGSISITTEQDAVMVRAMSHVLADEIARDQFTWLAVSFNKKTTKPEILERTKAYREARDRFWNEGLYDGIFKKTTRQSEVSKAFIAKHMRTAVSGTPDAPKRFHGDNFRGRTFPQVWVHSPVQASGEIDKVVGFPILPSHKRRALKKLEFHEEISDPELRQEIAGDLWKATLQATSSFMNSLRERLGPAGRTGVGGARSPKSYVQGALYNPRVLIALLTIFRIHYNDFELRPYVSPWNEDSETKPTLARISRVRIPGTSEFVPQEQRRKRAPVERTPAMRHGIDYGPRRKDGSIEMPEMRRTLYRPWLYARKPLFTKFEKSRDQKERAEAVRDAKGSSRSGPRHGPG